MLRALLTMLFTIDSPFADDRGDYPCVISDKTQMRFCPRCGRKTECEEKAIRFSSCGTPTKYNTEVKCPKHGTLILG